MLLGRAASDLIWNRGGVNSLFEPLRVETDQTGLELRKSLHCKALRTSSAESIVTKRVALGEEASGGKSICKTFLEVNISSTNSTLSLRIRYLR